MENTAHQKVTLCIVLLFVTLLITDCDRQHTSPGLYQGSKKGQVLSKIEQERAPHLPPNQYHFISSLAFIAL